MKYVVSSSENTFLGALCVSKFWTVKNIISYPKKNELLQ